MDGLALDHDIADDFNTPTDGDQTVTTSAEKRELQQLLAPDGAFKPPAIYVDRHGNLTNGKYTLSKPLMAKHLLGSLAAHKSQWYHDVDSSTATLDAAAYADAHGLWVGIRAKVPVVNGDVGSLGLKARPTSWINVYRSKTGFIHGSPGGTP